jgi:hypothetical protein
VEQLIHRCGYKSKNGHLIAIRTYLCSSLFSHVRHQLWLNLWLISTQSSWWSACSPYVILFIPLSQWTFFRCIPAGWPRFKHQRRTRFWDRRWVRIYHSLFKDLILGSGQIYLNCNLSGTWNQIQRIIQIQILQNCVHHFGPIIPLHSHSISAKMTINWSVRSTCHCRGG